MWIFVTCLTSSVFKRLHVAQLLFDSIECYCWSTWFWMTYYNDRNLPLACMCAVTSVFACPHGRVLVICRQLYPLVAVCATSCMHLATLLRFYLYFSQFMYFNFVESIILIRSVFNGVSCSRPYSMKLSEALHSVSVLYLGLLIFFYDAKFLTAHQFVWRSRSS